MKVPLGVLLAAGVLVVATQWRRPMKWLMYRIPPETPPDCAPRFRVWHHGVEVSADGFSPVPVRVLPRGVDEPDRSSVVL